MKAVILAAGMGIRLGKLTKNMPKAFLTVKGKPLIKYSLDNLANAGIKEAIIVVGHMELFFKEHLGNNYNGISIRYIKNEEYSSTGSMYSLSQTEGFIDDDILLLESDLLYDFNALMKLLGSPHKDAILVSPLTGSNDAVYICADGQGHLKNLGKKINKEGVIGELVGISKLSRKFLMHLYSFARDDYAKNEMKCHYEECILKASKTIPIKCLLMKLMWIEVDTESDLKTAREAIFPKLNELYKIKENKGKKSWDLLWEKKGEDAEVFDPIGLIGFDKAINVPKQQFVGQIIETIRANLELLPSDKLLEVGCGAGMLLIPLSKLAKTAHGVDLSLSLINKLRKAHPELAVFLAEANNLPFENECYDKILVHSVFQYFPSIKYSSDVVLELLRVCKKPGSIFIMDVPDLEKKRECIEYMSKSHPKKYSDKSLQHLFYHKNFFESVCSQKNLKYQIFDQNIKGYENSRFRFNVLIKK